MADLSQRHGFRKPHWHVDSEKIVIITRIDSHGQGSTSKILYTWTAWKDQASSYVLVCTCSYKDILAVVHASALTGILIQYILSTGTYQSRYVQETT